LVAPIEDLVKVMLRVTDYVMRAAPLGVFAAVAATITVQGIGVLATYGKFIGDGELGRLRETHSRA
jgi:Na+/H+-dicarboxylate symporter